MQKIRLTKSIGFSVIKGQQLPWQLRHYHDKNTTIIHHGSPLPFISVIFLKSLTRCLVVTSNHFTQCWFFGLLNFLLFISIFFLCPVNNLPNITVVLEPFKKLNRILESVINGKFMKCFGFN